MQQVNLPLSANNEQVKPSLHNTMDQTNFRFICERKVNFGEAVYIVGNIEQLGQWNMNCALRLQCYYSNYWIIDVNIPIDTQVQYKFFVSSFEHHFNQSGLQIPSKNWIGNQQGLNFRLLICKRDAVKIEETRKNINLKVMSFNIRCETKDDKDQLHWNHRRQNCVQVIKENYPSIIGIQQARRTQKPYLCQNLQYLYNYVGAPRDVTLDAEQVGIFYDKQRFLVVQYGFKWISESRQPGSIGFGARLPRNYTYMILEDTYTSEKFQKVLNKKLEQVESWIPRNLIMVINVHLDHESALARQRGVQMMAEEIQSKKKAFQDQLKDIFVFGDFNTHENPHVFHRFSQITPCLISTRYYFDYHNMRDLCDYQYTFNGFRRNQDDVNNPFKVIDHLFIHNEAYTPARFLAIREMVHKPKNPKYSFVSDHFPIMGIFKPVVQSNQIKH